MIITIDGPVGSGKSSVGKEICKRLNIYYLNTGLLYRAVAYIFLNILGKKLSDVDKTILKDLKFIEKISYEYDGQASLIFFNGKNLTKNLYTMVLGQQASIMSAKKEVREGLIELQRSIAKKHDIVADGRDCGSVIFQNADYKFFLTANLDIRAKRIFEDKKRVNLNLNLQEVKIELEKRDKRDMERDVAPLIISKDSIIIDNSNMTQKQTVDKFLSYIK
ncbi:(d)CMP kinase [Candidatus Babeliales bacterium]|nr:(d)CMP kinase [Candidatus Babeliales bacterium]